MATKKRFEFTVEGTGEFPFDMLRYDCCWPKSEAHDSHLLSGETRDRRRIVLLTDNPHAPTVGRWESFTWRVIGRADLRDGRRTP